MALGWNLQVLLEEMVARSGLPAVITVCGETVLKRSHGEIAAQAHSLAYGLIASGIQTGEG